MISKHSVVESGSIGSNVRIDEFCIIRPGAIIGDNVIIHPHVVVEEGVTIGHGVEIFPGSYIGKRPHGAGATARPSTYRPRLLIGNDCAIGPNAIVFYDVEIGHSTLLGDGASLREQVRVGHHCIISRYVTINYNTVIGDRTKIMDSTHITGNCRVGDDVFIGVLVSTTNDNKITGHYDEKAVIGPTIANRATVGSGVTILPAVFIGEGAIVGAGAVVTKDVAPYVVVMGVPAKAVRNLSSASSEV